LEFVAWRDVITAQVITSALGLVAALVGRVGPGIYSFPDK